MSASPQNDLYRPKLYYLSYTLVTSTPPKIPLPGAVFWSLQNTFAEIHKFLMGVRSSTLIYVCCFKHGPNHCSMYPNGCIVLVTEKYV